MSPEPVRLIGLAALSRMVFQQQDLAPVWSALIEKATNDRADASAMLDLSTLAILTGDMTGGLNLQAQALQRQRIYRRTPTQPGGPRLLVIAAPGDLMANTPIDFLLAGSDIALITLYVSRGPSFAGRLAGSRSGLPGGRRVRREPPGPSGLGDASGGLAWTNLER